MLAMRWVRKLSPGAARIRHIFVPRLATSPKKKEEEAGTTDGQATPTMTGDAADARALTEDACAAEAPATT